MTDYRRGLPLFRGGREKLFDILHIHWPEAYFRHSKDHLNWLRTLRYPLDLWLSAKRTPIVSTAHNLLPHTRRSELGVHRNMRYTANRSEAVFVHSDAAREEVIRAYEVSDKRVHVIPFGDHSVRLGSPLPREASRVALALPLTQKICLTFGTISPYKGIEHLARFWNEADIPHRLAIVGPILSNELAEKLAELAEVCPAIDLRLKREWLPDAELQTWLSASDCVVFNYEEVFSSGAAALARAYGIPLLMPHSLAFVDLHEPHPHVLRFHKLEVDFKEQLARALSTPADYDLAAEWRMKTSWERVANLTQLVYRKVLRPDLMKAQKQSAVDNE